MIKILVLGGTNFIGRNLVEKLTTIEDFDLTLLNRGLTNSHLFPQVKKIILDRNVDDIKDVISKKWDYIIDLSCYYPDSLNTIVGALPSSLRKYIFVSTCSVYQDIPTRLKDENSPTQIYSKEDFNDPSDETYGKRKSKCEDIIKASGANFTIFRPALVFGKYDSTDRFYYWLHQVKTYQNILVPNNGEQRFSVTYVHDLVKALCAAINQDVDQNIYNLTSNPEMSISTIAGNTMKILETSNNFISASSHFLKENGINQWTDFPLWLDCDHYTYSHDKYYNKEIKPIDFNLSLQETISYYDNLKWPLPKYGMDREMQLNLIKKINL